MTDSDYLFALRLQDELDAFNEEHHAVADTNKRKRDEFDLDCTQNTVHPQWEEIDPTPDVHSLFGAFDLKFFRGKLKCVELEWSKKMYRCAGICYQRRNAMGMSITIRLSEPLLKLRTRRNLIETLLHEMIHAYLFVQNVREPNGGHGPNFQKMMNDINRVAGTNITVYHTFHDEVAVYQTHVWRCNGICQHRKPFYGWVKRTRNLAPNPRDFWWAKHHETCGGTFQKVSEPEPKTKAKKSKTTRVENTPKITDFLNSSNKTSSVPRNNAVGGYTKMNGGGTVVYKPTTQNRISTITSNDATTKSTSPSSIHAPGGNLTNVIGFRDLNSSGSRNSEKRIPPSGRGEMLGSKDGSGATNSTAPSDKIRSIWANRFNNNSSNTDNVISGPDEKSDSAKNKVIEATSNWEEIDDDILIRSVQDTVIEIDDDSNDAVDVKLESNVNSSCLHKSIKEELLNDLGENAENIELIDDEFDDALLNESLELLTDQKVIDEIFGMDDLMNNFNEINDVVMKYPENKGNPNKEIISCPICQDNLPREQLSEHLDGCSGITVKVEPRKRNNGGKIQPLPFYKNKAKPSTSSANVNEISNKKDMLRKAGYDQETINRLFTETQEAKEYNDRILQEMTNERQSTANKRSSSIQPVIIDDGPTADTDNMRERSTCPVCNISVFVDEINQHLDLCLLGE